jgi:PAS domain S-box-containing protein
MIWVRTSKVPFRNEADETIGILGIFNDITEYKLAEESLRESNERFAVAFNKAPIIYTICSLEDGKYLDVNQRFVDISGFSRDEAIGKTPVELGLISRSDQEQRLYLIQRDGKIDEKELSLYTKSGKLVLCKYWSENITVAGRKCLLNIDLDITENRKLEQQFIQAQKMELVGQLAGGVAHDFNNMLHIIIGHAEMALLKTDPSQPLFSDLEQIRKSAYRSADLTRQLLAFARKQTILPKVLDLNETVAGMLKMLQRLIGEDISLIWRPAAKLWQVEVDPSQIDQIVANICVNARDAISGVGKITIESVNIALDEDYCAHHPGLVTGEYVRLTVSDDGCGMDKETLSHIFEPFFTTKGVGEGTGLGLATVYGAVKQNNGFIYTSSELGAGTTFTIYLPRYVGIDVEARTEVAATPVLHGQETILLVEDEPGIIFISTQMLEMLGYTVLAANSPDEAIHLAREYAGEIHLLLTDVIMPKMNGLDLAKNLLSAYPHMKLLFMSGYTADVISHQCLLLEGGYFIQKPISMQDLAAKVREVLNGK